MLFVLAGLVRILLSEEKKQGSRGLPPARLRRFERSAVSLAIGGAVFAVSALPFFWVQVTLGDFLRFDMWYAVMVVIFVAPRP